MKGVTLLELLIVIAIIATLSLIGTNSINSFKKEAVLDNTANELVSEIRIARSKSMNGEVFNGEKEDDFDPNDPNSLPEYGINILSDRYELIRKCVKAGGILCRGGDPDEDEPPIEKNFIDDGLMLSPEEELYFQRITGRMNAKTIELREKKGGGGRRISITDDFVITVSAI